jgi:hypothetical protein
MLGSDASSLSFLADSFSGATILFRPRFYRLLLLISKARLENGQDPSWTKKQIDKGEKGGPLACRPLLYLGLRRLAITFPDLLALSMPRLSPFLFPLPRRLLVGNKTREAEMGGGMHGVAPEQVGKEDCGAACSTSSPQHIYCLLRPRFPKCLFSSPYCMPFVQEIRSACPGGAVWNASDHSIWHGGYKSQDLLIKGHTESGERDLTRHIARRGRYARYKM